MKLLSEFRHSYDKRVLQKELSNLVNLTEGHKSASLPIGHEYYKLIWAKARVSINTFTGKYGGDFKDIAIGVPALREMESLAEGAKPQNKVLVIAITTFAVGGLLTVAVSLYRDLYMLLTYWVR